MMGRTFSDPYSPCASPSPYYWLQRSQVIWVREKGAAADTIGAMIGRWADHASHAASSAEQAFGRAMRATPDVRARPTVRFSTTSEGARQAASSGSAGRNITEFTSATLRDEQSKHTPADVSAESAAGKILITDDFTKQAAARAVPGAFWDRDSTRWYVIRLVDLTPRAALVLFKLFPEVATSNPEVGAARDRIMQDVRPFDCATPHNRRIGAPNVRKEMEKA